MSFLNIEDMQPGRVYSFKRSVYSNHPTITLCAENKGNRILGLNHTERGGPTVSGGYYWHIPREAFDGQFAEMTEIVGTEFEHFAVKIIPQLRTSGYNKLADKLSERVKIEQATDCGTLCHC
jgi:hypothetical protein